MEVSKSVPNWALIAPIETVLIESKKIPGLQQAGVEVQRKALGDRNVRRAKLSKTTQLTP
jgi:ribosomal protein L20